MTDQRPGTQRADAADRGRDADLERRVRSWLRDEPDRPPDTLASAALARSRGVGQRPGWLARWRHAGQTRSGRLATAGAAVTAALVLVLVVVALGQSLVRRPDAAASAPPSPVPATSSPTVTTPSSEPTPFEGRVEATFRLERRATALGSGFGSLWAGDDAGRLLRIDPVDGSVVATIELDGVACGPILAASTSLWLTVCGQGITTALAITVRVDPETNVVADRFDAGGGDGVGVSALGGLVWFVSDVEQGQLTSVDAATGAHVRDLTVGAPVRHLTAGFGSLWVSPVGEAIVLRLDPQSGQRLAQVALSGDAGFLATAADGLWVAEPHQWLVARIDPVTDRVASEIEAASGVSHLVVTGSGLVWALADEEALAVDPTASAIVDRFPVPRHVAFDAVATHVLASNEDTVWFADQTSLVRIGRP